MKQQPYRYCVEWIAINDEPNEYNIDTISLQVSVLLGADLFGIPPIKVAESVLKYRPKMEKR